MSSLTIKGTRADFLSASKIFDVVPVQAVIEVSDIRPLDALKALRTADQPSFIFESESPEMGASRYAYVCPKVDRMLLTGENEFLGDIDPISALREQFSNRQVAPVFGLPTLVTGAFGTGYAIGSFLNGKIFGPLIDKAAPGSGRVGSWYYRTFLK